MTRNKKTEHAGAKNGGGHWGPREEGKCLSKKANVGSGAKEKVACWIAIFFNSTGEAI
jgi:hypothetical protein